MKKIISILIIFHFATSIIGQTQTWTLEGTLGNMTNVITPDQGGNYIVGGINSGHPDFDPGPATLEIYSNANTLHGFVARYFNNGDLHWAFRIGTENGFGAVNDIFVDDSNHFYVTGCFRATMDFDPGPDTVELTCADGVTNDGYLAKYNTDGSLIYVKHIYGVGMEVPKKIMQLPNGNIILTGHTNNVAHFNPISGFDVIIPNGNFDVFFACYTSSGAIQWVKSVGGPDSDYLTAADNDPFGNLYIAGKFSDSIDSDPSAAIQMLYAQSYMSDVFIMKCDSAGNFIWSRSFGSQQDEYISSLAVNQFGEFFITGTGTDTINLDPGVSNFSLPIYNINGFVARYKVTGDFLWGAQPEAIHTPNLFINSMALDDSSNLYITGRYLDTIDFDFGAGSYLIEPGYGTGPNIFFAKYTRFGVLKFVHSIGGTFADQGNCISVDANKNIYLGGNFENLVDFDIGPGTHTFYATNSADAFYMKLKADGSNHYLNVSDIVEKPGISFYPNPANEEVTILWEGNENTCIEIFDWQGKTILIENVSNSTETTIFTRDYPAGIYFIRATNDSGSCTGRLIVNH